MPRRVVSFLSSVVAVLMFALIGRTALAEPPPQQSAQIQSQAHVDVPQPIRHQTPFRKLPGSSLVIRAVAYDGATNGVLTVQLQNRTPQTQTFVAGGLYFVPEGNPNTAPQRLGAVGPLQIAAYPETDLQTLEVPPGATMEVTLDVFCIDSHRASPSPSNKFHVAKTRMPRALTSTIENKADAAVAEERAKGESAPRKSAKGKIQAEVWESRDRQWIELDGEGHQEHAKKR